MHYTRSLLLTCLIIFVSTAAWSVDTKIKYTGTFTSLEYNKEGGDLLGEEIKIVVTRKGYQGALQISEGGPSQLMLVDVFFDKNQIRFEIPSSYPTYGGGVFEGKIDDKGIRGVLKFKGGADNSVKWVRGRSYWDK